MADVCRKHALDNQVCTTGRLPMLTFVLVSVLVSGLGQHWGTEAANSLRESTNIQWRCLKDKSQDKTVCPVWKKCLENSGKSDQILKILEAAGASKAPLINTLPSKTKGDSKGCRNPFVYAPCNCLHEKDPAACIVWCVRSDPESWDCRYCILPLL